MYKIGVIGDRESVLGFQAVGLDVFPAGDAEEAKKTLKLLTKRNRGRNVRRVMQEVKVFIRGWIAYFRVADMKRTLMS